MSEEREYQEYVHQAFRELEHNYEKLQYWKGRYTNLGDAERIAVDTFFQLNAMQIQLEVNNQLMFEVLSELKKQNAGP
jgi:hypothetical protein